ncbi:MAG: hypothetical protein HY340_03560 [Candidatus Kerfeldbacteria bacterium]|nr:hypothetical protein [Candidatus Kerfeldbacteria bacterium]
MFTQIFVGLIMVAVGYFLTWKANDFLANFGRIAFFERHLGTEGGSRLFYKLLGILLIITGFLFATGMLQSALRGLFSPAFISL